MRLPGMHGSGIPFMPPRPLLASASCWAWQSMAPEVALLSDERFGTALSALPFHERFAGHGTVASFRPVPSLASH